MSIIEHKNPSDIVPEHVARDEAALGSLVAFWTNVEAQDVMRGYIPITTSGQTSTELSVNRLRKQLEKLGPEQREELDEILCEDVPSPFIEQRLGEIAGTGYTDKLVAKGWLDRYLVDDDLFINFMENHNAQAAQRQRHYDEEIAPVMRTEFREKVEQGIKDKWLPKDAKWHLPRLERTTVVLDDGFRTTVRNLGGYIKRKKKDPENDYGVVIAPPQMHDPHTHSHEFTHVLEGEELLPPYELERMAPKHGLYRLFGDNLGGTAVNEAVVEHVAECLEGKSVDIIDPRQTDNSNYRVYRDLLFILSTKGKKQIDARLWIKALMEDESEYQRKGPMSARRRLERALKKSFPQASILKEIQALTANNDLFAQEATVLSYNRDLRRKLGITDEDSFVW